MSSSIEEWLWGGKEPDAKQQCLLTETSWTIASRFSTSPCFGDTPAISRSASDVFEVSALEPAFYV